MKNNGRGNRLATGDDDYENPDVEREKKMRRDVDSRRFQQGYENLGRRDVTLPRLTADATGMPTTAREFHCSLCSKSTGLAPT
jgi:hypothetical protein